MNLMVACLALSNSPEVDHGAQMELILISAGDFNALRLVFAMMAASLLHRGAADHYRSMSKIT